MQSAVFREWWESSRRAQVLASGQAAGPFSFAPEASRAAEILGADAAKELADAFFEILWDLRRGFRALGVRDEVHEDFDLGRRKIVQAANSFLNITIERPLVELLLYVRPADKSIHVVSVKAANGGSDGGSGLSLAPDDGAPDDADAASFSAFVSYKAQASNGRVPLAAWREWLIKLIGMHPRIMLSARERGLLKLERSLVRAFAARDHGKKTISPTTLHSARQDLVDRLCAALLPPVRRQAASSSWLDAPSQSSNSASQSRPVMLYYIEYAQRRSMRDGQSSTNSPTRLLNYIDWRCFKEHDWPLDDMPVCATFLVDDQKTSERAGPNNLLGLSLRHGTHNSIAYICHSTPSDLASFVSLAKHLKAALLDTNDRYAIILNVLPPTTNADNACGIGAGFGPLSAVLRSDQTRILRGEMSLRRMLETAQGAACVAYAISKQDALTITRMAALRPQGRPRSVPLDAGLTQIPATDYLSQVYVRPLIWQAWNGRR